MPKGIPAAGFRRTTRNMGMGMNMSPKPIDLVSYETDEEIDRKLTERFSILDKLTQAAVKGHARALIVSGPAGLGKSFTVERVLQDYDPDKKRHCIVKGYVRGTGLYKKLWQYRNKGDVLVFDDSDSIFFDDNSLNMLKAVCDTTETRVISYLTEGSLEDEDGGIVPKTFTFDGTIIFITNFDMDNAIETGHRLADHFKALISRSHYIDLAMKTKRDYLVRIGQVVKQGLLDHCTYEECNDVLNFIDNNSDRLRELSLRMALKIATIRQVDPFNWRRVAKVTCCRG